MSLGRRDTLPLVAALLAGPMVRPSEAASEEIPLWPGLPPGGGDGPAEPERVGRDGQVANVRTPRLILHRPARPNGIAVVVIAGGGYHAIELGRESGPTARWLASRGITAFELIYRLPGQGWPRDAPFADGRRAMRIVRAEAARLTIDARRVGVLGFSAGAHLAGMIAVGSTLGTYAPVDAADLQTARPDFAALIYPVLTMMPPWNHTQAFSRLLGEGASAAACAAYSVEVQVNADTPPVFLAQAADDRISPIENTLLMGLALLRGGTLPELHVFRSGGHGWGLGAIDSEVAAWTGLYARWLQEFV